MTGSKSRRSYTVARTAVCAVSAALFFWVATPAHGPSAALAQGMGAAPQGPASPESPAQVVRVLLSTGPLIVARVPSGGEVVDGGGMAMASAEGEAEVVFRPQGGGVAVTLAGKTASAQVAELRPAGRDGIPWFLLGPSRYRGALRVGAGQDGNLVAINVLGLEEYLYGVVPCEMPAGWPAEALKSQAVAARSFALSCCRAAASKGEEFDLGASTEGQVYGGLDAEDPRTNEAVNATRGAVLTYSGEVVRAVFHSSSAGHTENSEFVWSYSLPYLRGVEDPGDESPHDSWEFRATAAEIEQMLNASGYDLGEFLGVSGVERGVSGRWSRLLVRGSRGEAVLRGTEFRKALGLKSAWFDVSAEDAKWDRELFYHSGGQAWAISGEGEVRRVAHGAVKPGAAMAGYRLIPAGYVFRGRGYGHGVGLSQWGARSLANRGYKYPAILQHYYLNTRLETIDTAQGARPAG